MYFPPISIILGYRGLVITILEFVAFFDAIPLRNEEEHDCSMFHVHPVVHRGQKVYCRRFVPRIEREKEREKIKNNRNNFCSENLDIESNS